MHRFVAALCLAVASTSRVSPAAAGENYAVLVGVGDYDAKQLHKLPYSRNDILEFYDVLLQSGFKKDNVVLMHDDPAQPPPLRLLPESSRIRKQLTLMLAGRDEDDTLILAFAGHGVQFKGDQSSYFCPLDADLEQKETLIPLGEIYEALQACGAKRKLLLVDACRNDPRTRVARSRRTIDLESITRPQKEPVPESVVAFFSCAAGQQSFEWPELQHGVFFYQVLDVWRNGTGKDQELTLDALVDETRKRTEAFARNTLEAVQTPELHGKSTGKWVLRIIDSKVITNSLGMSLTLIPAGEFLMGTSDADVKVMMEIDGSYTKQEAADEQPQHRVRITRPFYMGTHEVTTGQFRAFVKATGYVTEVEEDADEDEGEIGGVGWDAATRKFGVNPRFSWKETGWPRTDEHPVVNVTWNDAVKFCEWLSQREGVEYRLPREAEWEYACRGGSTTLFSCGDDPNGLVQVGNVPDATARAEFADWTTISVRDGYVFSAPIGRLRPNGFGLYDMHGNVSEWCHDRYNAKYYARSRVDDPAGLVTGEERVSRGGDWFHPATIRSASREPLTPGTWGMCRGFRVASARITP